MFLGQGMDFFPIFCREDYLLINQNVQFDPRYNVEGIIRSDILPRLKVLKDKGPCLCHNLSVALCQSHHPTLAIC